MRNLVVAGTLILVVGIAACGTKTASGTTGPTTTAQPAGSTASSAVALSTTTTAPVMNVSSVTQLVTTFYNQYLACSGANTVTCDTGVVTEYGTPNLDSYFAPAAGYLYQADPILCAQDTPRAVHVSGVTTTPNQASGTVTEDFTSSITTMFVVVDQSGTLKIDTITCNPPLQPVKQPAGGGSTGSTGGSGTSLDGTYRISLPPGADACGVPSLSAETLTVNGATASIALVGGGTPFNGRATAAGSTFSIHLTNGISNAPGAIAIDLTGSMQPNGDLSGESANGGVYPGGTNGFSCNYPFTATRTSATAGPSSPVTTLPAGQSTVPRQTTAARVFRSPTGNISCQIDYQERNAADAVSCQTFTPPQSVTLSADGSFKTCTGTDCIGDPGEDTPNLNYGTSTAVGPFKCVSALAGITCTASGKGFEISRTGVTAVP